MALKDKPSEAIVYNFPHPIDAVYKEFTSKEYMEERAQWVKTDEVTVKFENHSNPKGVKAVLDRYVYRDYPKAFKGLFPEKQYMINTEYSEPDGDGYKGEYDCDVQGAPVLVEAEFTLKPKGDGCELNILADIYNHRAGSTGRGKTKGLAEDPFEVRDVLDEVVVLGYRTGHTNGIHLLKRIGTDREARDLAGDEDRRNRVFIGIGDWGSQVGRSRA